MEEGSERQSSKAKKLKPREGAAAIIERLLLEPVGLTIDGQQKRSPALEAIVLQLLQKTMAGNIRAARILKQYRDLALENIERKFDLEFVESAYTRAVAMLAKDGPNE